MKVTPAMCRAAYDFLREVSFTGARLPQSKRVDFITNKLKHHGYYGFNDGRHTVWVNKATRTLDQFFKIVAHEMCHIALRDYSKQVGDWHDAQFEALARSVEHDMGWPKGSV